MKVTRLDEKISDAVYSCRFAVKKFGACMGVDAQGVLEAADAYLERHGDSCAHQVVSMLNPIKDKPETVARHVSRIELLLKEKDDLTAAAACADNAGLVDPVKKARLAGRHCSNELLDAGEECVRTPSAEGVKRCREASERFEDAVADREKKMRELEDFFESLGYPWLTWDFIEFLEDNNMI